MAKPKNNNNGGALLAKGSLLALVILLGACSQQGKQRNAFSFPFPPGFSTAEAEDEESQLIANLNDGPPEYDIDVTHIPDAKPLVEPNSKYGNPKTYRVLGNHYHVMSHSRGYSAEGTASWYGRKFHGQRTSSGEPYDMFGMTAAHRNLPLPTYALVRNLDNGKEVVVKINDRGPFVKNRLIDLSYAAAKKLGIHSTGTAKVRITAIDPIAWNDKKNKTQLTGKGKNKKKATDKPTELALVTDKKPAAKASTKKAAGKATKKTDTKAKEPASTTTAAKSEKQIYIQLGSFRKKDNAQQLAKKATTLTQALLSTDVHILADKLSDKDLYKVRVGPIANKEEAQKLQKKLVAINGASSAKLVYE